MVDYIYCHSISDTNFGIEYKLKSEENSNQAIALYALSGKFQIYYVLDTFEIKKMNENEIAIYPRQIKAYVDDSFDFRDQNHIFNDNGSIKELGQPVGAWDYKEVRFDRDVSEQQMNKYAEKSGTFSANNVGAFFFLSLRTNTAITKKEYLDYKQINIYPIYNQDYQQTQTYFHIGCDFLVTSKTFKDIVVPQDANLKRIFKIIIKDF
ncbi:hypothetical protein HCCG_02283 [Helicobacter cinaedi CCUG 18818 = ATCC BAA-847]|uniref:Uncharacterized protein n=1 Tax=Helicobacter cinaedi CCUG 18818 = ATCC BAA-847 TaxID=537971 RepID=A0ABN0BEX8_9HELI|nr:DUF6402 family protein [Helicobacter cinaedi]EFR47734.1 hypothetical protein HCCG_02283 [Helicobacter cinaedi CCUG 18818 = ATCC BAA-847]